MQYENSKSIWDHIVDLFGRLRADKADNTVSRMSMKEMFGEEPYDKWDSKIR